jgi:predicted O-linked N-acetylglucosamine transferase (SPINDLY family)
VSRDFGQTPAAFLVLPVLEHLPRSACELVCYSDRTNDDEYTARFRAAASAWRTTYGQGDEQVAALIQRDNIDVLIDLMGHTGRRLLLFARRSAPFQLSWLGYASTTGMSAIDGILADRFHIREGEERWYSEQVLRMPHGYACYGPPRDSPPVGPLPALAAGHVTFGCFNNTLKYSAKIRAAWAEILRRAPSSRLVLKFQGLDDPLLQDDLRRWFQERGVAGERIAFEGWSLQADVLAAYQRIDLALDTQPYSGGLTTCESLWMGVPVVTFPGQTFAGRHSASYLTNAGYPQFIAADIDGYVELAVEWSSRLDELAEIRKQLRVNLQSSPVCNASQFAQDFLSVVRRAIAS